MVLTGENEYRAQPTYSNPVDIFDSLYLQISDLHISIYADESRERDLREFVTRTLDAIRPAAVVATGDLTDAKDRDHLGSRQYEEEWKTYHRVLQEANVRNKTVWMDIRGNHGERSTQCTCIVHTLNYRIFVLFGVFR